MALLLLAAAIGFSGNLSASWFSNIFPDSNLYRNMLGITGTLIFFGSVYFFYFSFLRRTPNRLHTPFDSNQTDWTQIFTLIIAIGTILTAIGGMISAKATRDLANSQVEYYKPKGELRFSITFPGADTNSSYAQSWQKDYYDSKQVDELRHNYGMYYSLQNHDLKVGDINASVEFSIVNNGVSPVQFLGLIERTTCAHHFERGSYAQEIDVIPPYKFKNYGFSFYIDNRTEDQTILPCEILVDIFTNFGNFTGWVGLKS